jgi:uncharacterized repeat protein (TIGR01451 family)
MSLLTRMALVALVLAAAWAPPAHALVFTVDAEFDAADENPGDGVCSTAPQRPNPRACTLRAAIQEANALGGAHTIVLPSGTYVLTLKTGDFFVDETSDASGSLKIYGNVTLMGAGSLTTTIDANRLYRVLQVHGTASVSGVTIQHGNAVSEGIVGEITGGAIANFGTLALGTSRIRENTADRGGGITNSGDLTLTSVDVSHNTAGTAGGIDNDGYLTITNSGVTFNVAVYSAGGILNGGSLTLSQSDVSHNIAHAQDGGGILNLDTLVMDTTTIAKNTAGRNGGGLMNLGLDVTVVYIIVPIEQLVLDAAHVTISHSTISGNSAFAGAGGGIANLGTLTLVNSTVSGNGTQQDGGGILNGGLMTATNVTIARNHLFAAQSDGGGLFTDAGADAHNVAAATTLHNTIVAENDANDCAADPGALVTSLGHNLDSDGTCGLTNVGDLSDANAFLGPLKFNGGTTMTHALLAGSAAIDTADDVGCPADDQRGVVRPQGSACDIGAYERVPGETGDHSNLSIAVTADRPRVTPGGLVKYTLTVTNLGPGAADEVTVIDRLPPGTTVVGARPSQGECAPLVQRARSTVTCALGTLGVRGTITITLEVTADRRGTLVNTAIVTGSGVDRDPRDNRATVRTEVR